MADNENAVAARTFRPNIPVPGKLDVHARNIEVAWRKFKRQWENYEVATRLDSETAKYRCSVFLACVGEDAFDIYEGFSFEQEEEKDDIAVVLTKFDEFCIGEANEIYETFLFNKRNQEEGETIDAYVTSLRKLAKTCNFGANEERMLRDRIVFGVKDDTVRQKLLEDRKLNLQSCIEVCRAHESSHQQAKAIVNSAGSVDKVNSRLTKVGTPNVSHKAKFNKNSCNRCGKKHSKSEACPARDAECRKCGKKGHYAVVCFSKARKSSTTGGQKVGSVKEESQGEAAFLGTVNNSHADAWSVQIKMEDRITCFKLDTGACVTVVPEDSVPRSKKPLRKPAKKLFGPGQNSLNVVGMFKARMEYKDLVTTQDVYVVKNMQEALLGRPAIEDLRLVQRVQSVVPDKSDSYKTTYPKLFSGLGKMNETYKITLCEGARPYSVTAPRRVPLPYQEKVKEELARLQELDVIRPVKGPTDWCAPIVVVPKGKTDSIRICVDLTKLNQNVKRENYPLPSTDQLLAQLDGATVFTKLDCNSGFYQIPLDDASQELTTFITPVGRFCFKRLPFGISSGPEVFHRTMSQLLSDIPGVICDIDDILISGRNQDDHDGRLTEVLQRLEKEGVTLNDKCTFSQSSIKFLGHILSKDGIAVDPGKVEAIQKMPRPANVTELRRVLGMLNFVQKFVPNLADVTRPLRELLKKDIQWTWGEAQDHAFAQIKKLLSSPPVLAHYSPDRRTIVSADASHYGLGAVLLQQTDDGVRPVFYASRSMTSTERRYAQVEKEALASTWACEKFADFLVGLPSFVLETDHRPLLALLKTKALDELSSRIQRFRMRLMRYSYEVIYTPGKNLIVADALSRAPVGSPEAADLQLESDTTAFVQSVIDGLPATPGRLVEIRTKQQEDHVCSQVIRYCKDGWPRDRSKVDPEIRPFFKVKDDLSVQEGLLVYRTRLVVPSKMKKDILNRLHEGHQGIVKCRALAKSSVWWPGLSSQIKDRVENCSSCEKERKPRPEPLKPSRVPDYPWQMVGADLFDWRGQQYLLVVDYFSRNIEVAHLQSSTSSENIIVHCKSIFARHGIPEVFISDNGPQFACHRFAMFAREWGFEHETSSPHYPQANGEAERAVRTVKTFLLKAEDPYLSMLNYRATPLQCGYSPAEMSIGRHLRTRVPVVSAALVPDWPRLNDIKRANAEQKDVQKKNFDRRHRAKPLPALSPGDPVWIKHPAEAEGEVVRPTGPRSYEIQTPTGRRRRNRRHLNRRSGAVPDRPKVNPAVPSTLPSPAASDVPPDPDSDPVQPEVNSTPSPGPDAASRPVETTTRSGRAVRAPIRLDL